MTQNHFIIATAGHVDHGKSALVKALTGTDPDRLPEEKARGITIDLGFAHLELPSTLNPQPSIFQLGIIDVPGHEDFVKNMVAGVGSIDLALFVVAADDGWMPQTEEHLQILSYLDVSHAVVALTKIDLTDDEEAVKAQLREQLTVSPFAEAPIIPTSVVTGRGLDELKTTLALVLSDTPPPRDIGKPRLPVDRVFTLRGIGTVVTGTLTGGKLHRGQAVVLQPSGQPTRVRSLQNHNRDVEVSGPGMRTALNLPDLDADSVQRGDIITLSEHGDPSETLDVMFERSSRPMTSKAGATRPLKDGALVRIHLGSTNVPAHVFFLQTRQLCAGERALAELRLAFPVFAFAGDRFTVRDWSEQTTLGGGMVLDPDACSKRFRSEPQRQLLERRAQSPNDATAFVQSQLERDGAVPGSALLIKSRFSAAEISRALALLAAERNAIAIGERVADGEKWRALRLAAMDAIDAEHRAHPEHPGLPLSELRTALEKSLPDADGFDALIADLCAQGFSQAGAAIRRAAHRPALPPHLQAAAAGIRAALAARPLEPPSRKELAPDSLRQQALRFLLESGEAIELGDEVVMSTDAFVRATGTVKLFLREHGSATASELRQALGTSRRIVIPLLERLDKDGVTSRAGDKRFLKK